MRAGAQRALLVALVALVALLGCGGSSPLGPNELPPLDAREGARVRALAPDLYARALAVRELAATTTEPEAAGEQAARARLLFEAATLEADRLQLEARRDALWRAAGRDAQARVGAVEARLELERTQRLTELEQRARPESTQRQRAYALLAAAQALHAPADAVQVAENALLGAELAGAGAEASNANMRALEAAERALGAARAQQPAPGAAELASLAELGRERGLAVRTLGEGSVVELAGAFVGGSGKLTPTGRSQLAAVLGLLRAHPHGPVQPFAGSAAGRAALARALAPENAARLQLVPGAAPPPVALGKGDAALLLPAYGTAPKPPDSAPSPAN